MHGRLGLAGRPGGEPQKRHIIAPGLHRLKAHRLFQRQPVEFGVVVGGPVKAHDPLKHVTLCRAGLHLLHQPGIAEGKLDLCLLDIFLQFRGAQHRHGVDHNRARLGRRQPAGHHRRIIGGPDQDAVAGFDAQILHQRMRQPVGPVGKLLVGALPPVADQCGAVAKAPLHHGVRQLDARVQMIRVVKPIQQEIRPLFQRRQRVAGECVGMCGCAQFHDLPSIAIMACRAITTRCTSLAPS